MEVTRQQRGFIKIHRQMLNSDIWKTMPPSYKRVWDYILLNVAFADHTATIRNNKITVKKGEIVESLEIISNRCSWMENNKTIKISTTQISNILGVLSDKKMISKNNIGTRINPITSITVLNFDKYQNKRTEQCFVKIYKKIMNSDIWTMPLNYQRVFEYFLLNAEYNSDQNWTDNKRGELTQSLAKISDGCAWYTGTKKNIISESEMKKIIKWLLDNNMITKKTIVNGFKKCTSYSITNYNKYQDADYKEIESVIKSEIELKPRKQNKKKLINYNEINDLVEKRAKEMFDKFVSGINSAKIATTKPEQKEVQEETIIEILNFYKKYYNKAKHKQTKIQNDDYCKKQIIKLLNINDGKKNATKSLIYNMFHRQYNIEKGYFDLSVIVKKPGIFSNYTDGKTIHPISEFETQIWEYEGWN